jgi:hypothetical protein
MRTNIIKKMLAAVLAMLMLAAVVPAGALPHGSEAPLPECAAEEVVWPVETESTPEPTREPEEPAEPQRDAIIPEAEVVSDRSEMDIRVFGEYYMRGETVVMLSTLLDHFDISVSPSNVISSNESCITVEREGSDWRITVVRSFSGFEYVYFSAGGLDYGFDFECGKAYDYVDRRWENGQIVSTALIAWNPTDIAEAGTNLTDGWYVSKGSNTNFNSRIEINGEVNLILLDGSKLNANGGVRINGGGALKVYGGPNDSGVLYAHPSSGPGIGNGGGVGYSLLISGGTIDAKGGKDCAGIGGGSDSSGISYLTINGGKITAKGGNNGPGIGRGNNNTWAGDIAINGGTIEAEGGENAAGIGGGKQCGTGPLTINGGKVTARGGELGAGIGGGANCGQGYPVTINGGDIDISAPAASGAGIGGGAGYMEYLVEYYGGNGGQVNINGGRINIRLQATRSAGIGGGGYDCHSGTLNGDVIITGGELYIEVRNGYIGDDYTKSQGAGIGGGSERTPHGEVRIIGGTVSIENYGYGAGIGGGASEKKPSTAGSGGSVTIGGTAFVVSMSNGGAGIGGGGSITGGGGGGNGGNLTINGGYVCAISGEKGAGVGGGNDGSGGTLIMNDGYLMALGGYLDYNYIRDHGLYSGNMPGITPSDQGWANLYSNLLMHFFVSGTFGGAGIGGGDDGNGGTVIINGGKVVAKGGRNSTRAIGRGDGGKSDGSLTIHDEAAVFYARISNEDDGSLDPPALSTAANREKDCKNNALAVIELCEHPGATYESVGESGHLIRCPHCKAQDTGVHAHDFEADPRACSHCGYERVKITLLPGSGSGSVEPVWAEKGAGYTIPGLPNEFTAPEGKVFFGWLLSSANENHAPGSEITLSGDVTLTAQWTDPYNIWVGGIRVTEANRNDVLGDGKVSYDPASSTLNLDGVDGFTGMNDDKRFIYANRMNLTITGSGDLYPIGGAFCRDVICVTLGSLTLNGDFTITNTSSTLIRGSGLNVARDVIFEGGSITVTAAGNAVTIDSASRKVVVKDGMERLEATTVAETGTFYAFKVYGRDYVILEDGLLVTEFIRTDGNTENVDLSNARHAVIEHGVVVTFDLNGGSLDGSTGDVTVVLPKNSTLTLPGEPVRDELIFGGWYMDEAFTQPFDPTLPITEDITLWARWTIEYEVTVRWSDLDSAPGSVSVVLQHAEFLPQEDGSVIAEWTTQATIVIDYTGDNWTDVFVPITYEGENTEDHYRIRELDMFGQVVLSADELGDEGVPMAVYEIMETVPDPEEPDPGRAITLKKVAYFVKYVFTGRRCVEINNFNELIYTVENTWDIDLIGGDRPEEIQVVLQRRNNWISWESVEVLTLNTANGWSGEFGGVPAGHVNADGTAEAFSYRIRQLKARGANDPEPVLEDEILADASARVVYDKWDFDKPYLKLFLDQIGDPLQFWSFEATMDFLTARIDKALLGEPTVKYHVDEYTDIIGKRIEAHDTKYFVKYDQSGQSMELTNIAVLDISIYKRWLNFEDEEMPESVYLMLLSKVDDEYAEQVGVDGFNIYTPVLTAVYGDRFDISKLTGLNDLVKEGVKSILGDNIAAEAINGVVGREISKYLSVGLAASQANGKAQNPLNRWRMRLGVKKYGGFGVPMEFAGAELVTGLMEMAVDALIKFLGIPKIHMPVMFEPTGGYWSIKGYAIWYPVLDDEDIELTGNVINIKFHGSEDGRGTAVGGTVHWENDNEATRPESVQIHVYVKSEGGERTEVSGSPVTVMKDDGWVWSLEISKDDAIALTEDESDDGVIHYNEFEIEEEVPAGYEARYEGMDVINRGGSLVPPAVEASRAELRQRHTEDSKKDLRFIITVSFNDSTVVYRGEEYGPVPNAYRIESFGTSLSAGGNSVDVPGVNIFAMCADDAGNEDPNKFTYTAVLVGIGEQYFDMEITAAPYLTFSLNGEVRTVNGNSISSSVDGLLNAD